MNHERASKFKRSLAKKIIDNSFSASAWVFETIIQMGELTLDAFLSPNIYADFPSNSIDFSTIKELKKSTPKEMTIRQNIRRLRHQGFIEKKENKYILTKAGRDLANYVKNRQRIIKNKWDGKYRVIIFDIPEKNRRIRDWLRQELNLLNYQKLQESVFISKYPLTADLVREIKRKKIGNYVNYLLVDRVYKNFI